MDYRNGRFGRFNAKPLKQVIGMRNETVDLYDDYGLDREAAKGGFLTLWVQQTPETVSTGRRRPAILILPGGGYEHTSLREAEPVALRFAARGYAAFVLHYSCAPSRFPTALREAAMAMGYIREHVREFETDPNMVAALGFSAGGHLCGTLGTRFDGPEVSDLGPAELLRPDALCLCYPVTVSHGRTHAGSFANLCGEDGALADGLSLEKLVRPDMPPVFLWHTRDDASVPCRGSLILAQALEEAGVDFAMHIYRNGQHGLSTADAMAYPCGKVPRVSRDVPGWIEACMDFLSEVGLYITDTEVRL